MSTGVERARALERDGIETDRVRWNLSVSALYEEAVRRNEAVIAAGGFPLIIPPMNKEHFGDLDLYLNQCTGVIITATVASAIVLLSTTWIGQQTLTVNSDQCRDPFASLHRNSEDPTPLRTMLCD